MSLHTVEFYFNYFLHEATPSHFDSGVGYVHTEYVLFGGVLPILYNPCEILFSFICDGYVLTRVNLRLRPHYFLVAFYWASGAATLLFAMLDPANIVVLFYLVRFYTYPRKHLAFSHYVSECILQEFYHARHSKSTCSATSTGSCTTSTLFPSCSNTPCLPTTTVPSSSSPRPATAAPLAPASAITPQQHQEIVSSVTTEVTRRLQTAQGAQALICVSVVYFSVYLF